MRFTANTPTWIGTSRPAGIPGQGVASVAVDPTNATEAVAVIPGFSGVNALAAPSRHVFATKDGGATWSDISGVAQGGLNNLPDLPLYSVVIDPIPTPHTIIVADDGGVFQSGKAGQTWQKLGLDLPNAQMVVVSLDSSVSPEILRVASWGRGAFELTLPPSPCEPLSKRVEVLSSNLRNLRVERDEMKRLARCRLKVKS